MTNELTLPQPVANFVRAINDQDADRFLSTFTNDAAVTDGGREFRGAPAIKEWSGREIFDVNVTVDVLDVADRDGQTVIIAKVDGAFDKTGLPDPVLLEQRFTLDGGKIAAFSSQLASEQS